MGAEQGGKCDEDAGRSLQASLGAAVSSMAESIGSMVAWQRAEWENQRRRRRGEGHAAASGGTWLDISPEAAVPIPDVQRPRRIAYVDGGNATLLGSPGWSVGFNRVAYAVCQGRTVHRPLYAQRVDFLSLLAAEPAGGEGGDAGENGKADTGPYPRRYALRTIPVGNGEGGENHLPRLDAHCVPTDEDMGNIDAVPAKGIEGRHEEGGGGHEAGETDGEGNGVDTPGPAPDTRRPATDHNRSRMMSVPRAFAEWKMAAAVVAGKELAEGDILVLDGTLQTGYGGEARLADALYGAARRRGVIVCALAKTTTMMGPGGVPVLYAAHEAARAAGLHAWYMPLARRVPGDGSGFVLAARLHRHSRFTYRLEVLRDQYDLLQDAGGLGAVVGSIAANSGDPSFPGYPYGLISADRHARVRGAEAAVYRRVLLAELARHEMGRTMLDHTLLLSAHKTLDRAVGG